MFKYSIKKLLLFISIIQVFICLSFLGFSICSTAYQTYNEACNGFYQIGEQFLTSAESDLNRLADITLFPFQLAKGNDTYLSQALRNKNHVNDYKFYNYVTRQAQFFMNDTTDFAAVYDLDRNGIAAFYDNSSYQLCTIREDSPWFQELKKQHIGKLIFIPSDQFSDTGIYKEIPDLCLARGIFDIQTGKIIGYCISGLSSKRFQDLFHQICSTSNQTFILLKDNTVLYSTASGNEQTFDFLSHASAVHNRYRKLLLTTSGLHVYSVIYHDSGYSMLIDTPLSDILGNIGQMDFLFTMLITCFLIIMIILTHKIIHYLLHTITQLIQVCDSYTLDHEPTFDSLPALPSEFQKLLDSFSGMSLRIHELVKQLLAKQRLQQETELKLLKTQINPHYLYNTLAVIQSKAYLSGNSEVANMTELLGKNLQYGLRNTTLNVPLSEELKQLEVYRKILSYQYGDRLLFNLCIDPELMSYLVPKLIFQPIVENAVIHGIASSEQILTIDILAWHTDHELIFQISDDGQGMTQEELERLNKSLADENTDRIGLKNTHRRIQLKYGSSYGISIKSTANMGTTIQITLPWEPILKTEVSK